MLRQYVLHQGHGASDRWNLDFVEESLRLWQPGFWHAHGQACRQWLSPRAIESAARPRCALDRPRTEPLPACLPMRMPEARLPQAKRFFYEVEVPSIRSSMSL